MPAVPAGGEAGAYDRIEAARRLWRACRAIDGTHAEDYLQARAIHRCRFPALRFHPALNYRDRRGFRRLPALVAVIVPERGDFNDDLVAFGAQALAARIAPLFHAPARGPAR